ncbi:MAG: Cytochrome c4 [Steroidobacteraceae bacterium]|nr:Cytochrome c4 [Steroidobacteraceae bacterium]
MSFARRIATVAALSAVVAGAAGVAHADGNAAHGKELAYTCLGCHAIEDYKNVYPTYSVPMLRGQNAAYIVAALQGYRSGERSHGTMHAQAASLSEQDIQDIAAYLGSDPLKASGNPPAAEAPQAAQVCVACHGSEGVAMLPEYPNLAGQHADYLERALEEYKKGARKNPIMAGFASTLTSADIKVIADYYSRQKPGLEIVPRRASRFSAR